MGNLATAEIQDFLQHLSEQYSSPATLYLLGGSALCFWVARAGQLILITHWLQHLVRYTGI